MQNFGSEQVNKKFSPVIGITIDSGRGAKTEYSRFPWYAVRSDISKAITQFGGIPILLPYAIDSIENYCNMCDGLIFSGGDFDIPPSLYGAEIQNEKVKLNEERTSFELALVSKYFETGKPILGICAGMQLLNVLKGGDLIQHIPDAIDTEIEHEQPHPKNIPSHIIKCNTDSKLFSIVKSTEYMVNSTHHQAVGSLGENLIISAIAKDGIVEAIEHETHPFCIGVEWHPEFIETEQDRALLKTFVAMCVEQGLDALSVVQS